VKYRIYRYLAIRPLDGSFWMIDIEDNPAITRVAITSLNGPSSITFSLLKRFGDAGVKIYIGPFMLILERRRDVDSILDKLEHFLQNQVEVIATIKEYEGDEPPWMTN